MQDKNKDAFRNSSQLITHSLLKHVGQIAESCSAKAIFVYVDTLKNRQLHLSEQLQPRIIYVTRTDNNEDIRELAVADSAEVLKVPDIQLSRLGQVKVAMLLAIGRKIVKAGDIVIFLSGMAASGELDTIIAAQVTKEHEILSKSQRNGASSVKAEVIERSIDLATQLGSEGREGTPLGALFVIGNPEQILPLTRQLILNPFQGYPKDQRNILDEQLAETVKELATIDGAFIISGDGLILSAGAYLKTTTSKDIELPRGLGSRHYAAATITASTDAVAIAVSKSTGKVTIFREGRIITEIEKATTREFTTEQVAAEAAIGTVQAEALAYDRFDEIIKDAVVLDIDHKIDFEEFFKIASQHLGERLKKKPENLYNSLIEREKETSTVLGPSLAIPHIIIDGSKSVDILLARCQEGIKFSDNGPAVKIAFVMAGTRDERNFHLRALASIAQIMQNPGFEEQWLAAKNPQALKELVLLSHRQKG